MKSLIEKIQKHMPAGTIVTSASELSPRIMDNGPNVSAEDATIYPFVYRTNRCDYEMRGAFTNADPIWEEDDPIAFADACGMVACPECGHGVDPEPDDSGCGCHCPDCGENL